MKFVIYSYRYNWRYGGLVVLDKLAEVLTRLGHETYIVREEKTNENRVSFRRQTKNKIKRLANRLKNMTSTFQSGRKNPRKAQEIKIEKAIELASYSETVVIYPEIVAGNPLKAARVARWVLFFPGVNGGDRTYDESEFVFTYSLEFVKNTRYESSPVVRVVDSLIDNFFDMNLVRSRSAILVKKGSADYEGRSKLFLEPFMGKLLKIDSADDMITKSPNISEYNRKLNSTLYFISFDNHSYHSVLASLAGCKSVVIPEIGKTEEAFFLGFPEAKIAGVTYGFKEDVGDQFNQNLFRLEKDKIESANTEYVANLVELLENYH